MADDGLLESGNINLFDRPQVKNPNGSTSTVRSMSININGNEVLLPTVSDDGRILTPKEAVDQYKQTGKHLGKYKDVDSANKAAQQLHEQQEKYYMPNFQNLKTLLQQKQVSPEIMQREEPAVTQGKSMIGPPAPTADQATNQGDFMARAMREFQNYQNPTLAAAEANQVSQPDPALLARAQQQNMVQDPALLQQAKFLALKNKLRGQ